jgi:hypothetical protein
MELNGWQIVSSAGDSDAYIQRVHNHRSNFKYGDLHRPRVPSPRAARAAYPAIQLGAAQRHAPSTPSLELAGLIEAYLWGGLRPVRDSSDEVSMKPFFAAREIVRKQTAITQRPNQT